MNIQLSKYQTENLRTKDVERKSFDFKEFETEEESSCRLAAL